MERYDAHKIITNFFNVEMNEFISKYLTPEIEVKLHSGGMMQFREVEGKFLVYADWLKFFRDNFFENYIQEEINFETIKKEFKPLLDFFARVSIRSSLLEDEIRKKLKKEFLDPISNLFKKLDRFFNTNYFKKTIESELRNPPEVKFIVKNFFSPAINSLIEISYLANIEFKEWSNEIPLATLETNQNGFAKINLLKGGYKFRIKLGKSTKTIFENITNNSKNINIQLYNLIELVKYKFFRKFV